MEMADYMLNTPPPLQPPPPQPQPQSQMSLDRLSFAEVMQFADFRPKLISPDEGHSTKKAADEVDDESRFFGFPSLPLDRRGAKMKEVAREEEEEEEEEAHLSDTINYDLGGKQMEFGGGGEGQVAVEGKSRRKRARSMKTSEEVESQRMTHIAVERNRRRQMNEHLRMLRSLMPTSYVQRGDQASIIGGAIEFVRELEQLLQCLESQKRRRLYGSAAEASLHPVMPQQPPPPAPPFFPPLPGGLVNGLIEIPEDAGLREDSAENKSSLADIEVRLLGLDAMIKILSRRRDGQLIKIIAALEDMQLSILHTNITTIEQTVLYSFNVKIIGETNYSSAEEIASSVQQILGYIESNAL
ncbi:hypothetical protein HPP92_007986 [Vanilla planifolia]|uniref:BHLH domain-containing protein n=1 Tax=Vanilla planifolia TaxID=51239 RepID=A0A835VB78_VANPL|nr:hypothetical protein HPP92_007986 [Vanilla planifolia]